MFLGHIVRKPWQSTRCTAGVLLFFLPIKQGCDVTRYKDVTEWAGPKRPLSHSATVTSPVSVAGARVGRAPAWLLLNLQRQEVRKRSLPVSPGAVSFPQGLASCARLPSASSSHSLWFWFWGRDKCVFTQKRAQGVDGRVCSLSVRGPTLIRTHKGRADNTGHFLFVQEQQRPKDERQRDSEKEREREKEKEEEREGGRGVFSLNYFYGNNLK